MSVRTPQSAISSPLFPGHYRGEARPRARGKRNFDAYLEYFMHNHRYPAAPPRRRPPKPPSPSGSSSPLRLRPPDGAYAAPEAFGDRVVDEDLVDLIA